MAPFYTADNTEGYTPAELDALNEELQDLLADLAQGADGHPSPDDVHALRTRHADDVARR